MQNFIKPKQKIVENRVTDRLNIANIITLSRIVLIIPFIIVLNFSLNPTFVAFRYYAAAFFFILASTDLIDGFIARKYNQKTAIGAMLDPLADKLLVSAALIFLIGRGVQAWMVYLILARELIITGLRSLADNSGQTIPAKISGKIKTASQMLAILLVIVQAPNAHYFMLAATIITVYSGIEYLWIERKLLKNLF